jgi:hypothetical protein
LHNIVPAKRNSWKVILEKKEHGKEFLFFQELESKPLEFLELESQKKECKKNAQPSV